MIFLANLCRPGNALELAKNADVDGTLVHARASEDRFIAVPHSVKRREVMDDNLIHLGSMKDSADVKRVSRVIYNEWLRRRNARKVFFAALSLCGEKSFFGILQLLEINTHIPCAFQANNGL